VFGGFPFQAREPCDVAITLTPFDIEPLADGAMDCRPARIGTKQPGHAADALVNLPVRAFDVGLALAGADHWLFLWRWHGMTVFA